MWNEEVDRRINFIINHQAQFASDIQQLREAQAQLQAIQVKTEEVVTRLATVTLQAFKEVSEKINALVDSQIRTDERWRETDERWRETDERWRETDERFRQTDEYLRQTDERLRKLTDVVDRHLKKDRNGH